ncbi:SDR family NAD(P)-dependent oxidoreductase [Thermogemmatispora sp.]|uniref:SDR family NAD(P)-dependent oxidoreductase n=1 Tax=Thermogemmatispora sp. TaxID=1968838 RepID=UPI0035E43EEA
MRLEGKVAVITGVSHAGQMGFALAGFFAEEGARLVIASRSGERVAARAAELQARGALVKGVAADLTSEEGAQHLVEEALQWQGRVDVLVNLAGGLTKYGPPHEVSLQDWESELNNNLRTTFLCTRAVWPSMLAQGGGKIINFSRAYSIQNAGAQTLAYNCAKAGVDALTRTFAQAGKGVGIYVNAIAPGLIATQANLEELHPSPTELRSKWVSPREVAEVAIFLASAASDGVTGAIIPVQGRGI